MMMSPLFDYAKSFVSDDPTTKPLYYYGYFDEYFQKNKISPKTILEIGVFKGESTKVFSKVFPDAKIVALDFRLREIDFSGCPNVKYIQADQTDIQKLSEIISREFPQGIDLVIEDASHVGAKSHATFFGVFPFLKDRGVYIVEDWGTGYRDDWEDGKMFEPCVPDMDADGPNRIRSHDFGMVGFVKSLVDLTHETAIRTNSSEPPRASSRLESLEFRESVCIARKAPGQSEQGNRSVAANLRPAKKRTLKRKLKNVRQALRDLFR